MGLEKFVWEGLNRIGRPLPHISTPREISRGDSSNQRLRNNPIWHTKSDLDEFVARSLNLRLNDYGLDKSRNPLYKAIANEIALLRRKKILIDWRQVKQKSTGMGVWRLDKTKLVKFVYNDVAKEIKQKNFHSDGLPALIYVRQKQNAFRSELLHEYGQCVFCGFKLVEYMIGAHIVPYATMRRENPENSMNPSNGLLLCRLCDVAFERGSITVDEDYGIEISKHLQRHKSRTVVSWLRPIPSRLKIKRNAKYPPEREYLIRKNELLR